MMSEEVLETAEAAEAVEAPVSKVDTSKYTVEDVQKELKPLSQNGFVRFWQKIWRWWLGVWYGFCDKHPKLSGLLQMAFFFIVFSEGVTIYQYIVMTFLPLAFTSMWDVPFVWPAVALPWQDAAGNALNYAIFNEPVKYIVNLPIFADDKTTITGYSVSTLLASTKDQLAAFISEYGDTYRKIDEAKQLVGDPIKSLQCSGLGNFIAFEIAVFTAQCINFPLQRNITYRSHGNPWWQAMWYFIGWVLVSIATNALWGIMNPLFLKWNWPDAIIGLIKTVLTGGVSLVIFFFIFMVIFPDNNKMAKKSKAKYDKLVEANAPTAKVVAAENTMKLWEDKALKSNAEKDYFKAKSQLSAAIMKYNALVKNAENPKLSEEDKAAYPEKIENAFTAAVEAIIAKNEKESAFNEAKAIS